MSALLEQKLSTEELTRIMRTYQRFLEEDCEYKHKYCSDNVDHCFDCFIKDFSEGKIKFVDLNEEDEILCDDLTFSNIQDVTLGDLKELGFKVNVYDDIYEHNFENNNCNNDEKVGK